MGKLLILVEGQTEEQFVNKILYPYFQQYGVYTIPVIVKTKISTGSQSSFKGGKTTYRNIKRQIERLLYSKPVCVTTMFDFYGLSKDFIGLKTKPEGSGYIQVSYLEQAFYNDVNHPKFLPYLMLYEFETMLFVSPTLIAKQLLATDNQKRKLLQIKAKVNSPEEINDNPNTAPSKQIVSIFPDYRKTSDGPLIIAKIGLEKIREECTHFNNWLKKLEGFCKEYANFTSSHSF